MLTTDQVEQYTREGYLILELGFDPELLDRVIAEQEQIYAVGSAPGAVVMPSNTHPGRFSRIQDGWRASASMREVAVHPHVLAVLRDLYQREPLPFQTLNFSVGTEQPTHSDTIHFNSMPSGFMCGVWVALEDMDAENGPLRYYPGSHRLPEYTMQDMGLRPTSEDYPKYEIWLQNKIEELGLQEARAHIRKGQALLWAANLLHGGSPQLDKERTRYSQVTHYFFEGCRYYTPMFSTPDAPAWRNPQWIR